MTDARIRVHAINTYMVYTWICRAFIDVFCTVRVGVAVNTVTRVTVQFIFTVTMYAWIRGAFINF